MGVDRPGDRPAGRSGDREFYGLTEEEIHVVEDGGSERPSRLEKGLRSQAENRWLKADLYKIKEVIYVIVLSRMNELRSRVILIIQIINLRLSTECTNTRNYSFRGSNAANEKQYQQQRIIQEYISLRNQILQTYEQQTNLVYSAGITAVGTLIIAFNSEPRQVFSVCLFCL